MSKKLQQLPARELLRLVESKLRPPLGIVLGAPREVAEIASHVGADSVVNYQMDLHQARRSEEELHACGARCRVVTAPDLWDLPERFATLVYPAPAKGERGLKLDMIEQAYHVLSPSGAFVVLSPYERDALFPTLLKKVFGRVHAPLEAAGQLLWCTRQGERPRRRHEVTVQVRGDGGRSLRFVSRPGVFSYGRFDDGARALTEVMRIEPGDAVLDLGCGCGKVGVIAGLRAGPDGRTTFTDSNVRAVSLAEMNARTAGLTKFDVVATHLPEQIDARFDVVAANPPYYAQQSIAHHFIDAAKTLLKPGGRLYLVTKQPSQVEESLLAAFDEADVVMRRGYNVFCAVKK